MTHSRPYQWLLTHQSLGHTLCLVLDSENERQIRQTLLKNSRPHQYLSVYGQTVVADLCDAGPFVFTVDPGDKNINELLMRPDSDWGWFASVPKGHMPMFVEHWRKRLIIGDRPHQALYRFQDNRVLAKALRNLPVEAYPGYLGPAISVCYWQGTCWECTENPAPGTVAVPDFPLWLQLPLAQQQAMKTRLINAHRFLLAEHLQAYAQLAEQQDPQIWLRATLDQAEAWNWLAPDPLEFLLTQSLQALTQKLASHWHARPGEPPDEHFERVRLAAQVWQGDAPQ